jgi:hypothetical protein
MDGEVILCRRRPWRRLEGTDGRLLGKRGEIKPARSLLIDPHLPQRRGDPCAAAGNSAMAILGRPVDNQVARGQVGSTSMSSASRCPARKRQ